METFEYRDWADAIFSTLEEVLKDPAGCVRVCMMPRLANFMNLDAERTLNLFIQLTNSGEEEFIKNSFWSVQFLVNYNFKRLIPYFKLIAKMPMEQKNTAVLLSVEWLKGQPGIKPLLKQVLKKSPEAKAAMVDVALGNYFDEDQLTRKKCIFLYEKFLNEKHDLIVHEYSTAFLHLKPAQFPKLYPLLKSYAKSNAAKKRPDYFFKYLIQCAKSYPVKCLKLLSLLDEYEQPDITKSGHFEDEPVHLAINIYSALNNSDSQQRKYQKKALLFLDKLMKDERFGRAATRIVNQT